MTMTTADNELTMLPAQVSQAAREYKAAGIPERELVEQVMAELVRPAVQANGIGPVTAVLVLLV
jgi:hypothetical protein